MATYRGAAFAGVVTNTVFGFILAYVLLAVFEQRPHIGGFDAVDAVTFTFVAQGLLAVVGIFGTVEMAERIRTGDVTVDLCRPFDYQAWWAAVAYGRAGFLLLVRGVPPFLLGALVLDLRRPEQASTWVSFLVAVLLAVGVGFAWGFLLQLSAFWLLDVRGPNQVGWLTAQFLAGTFVPLVLFPPWLETAARSLPFAAMMQLPVEIFLEKHQGADLAGVYAHQLAWLAVLVAAGRLVLGRAERRIVVQGG
jgi:ABC-2 type transport system permease protein